MGMLKHQTFIFASIIPHMQLMSPFSWPQQSPTAAWQPAPASHSLTCQAAAYWLDSHAWCQTMQGLGDKLKEARGGGTLPLRKGKSKKQNCGNEWGVGGRGTCSMCRQGEGLGEDEMAVGEEINGQGASGVGAGGNREQRTREEKRGEICLSNPALSVEHFVLSLSTRYAVNVTSACGFCGPKRRQLEEMPNLCPPPPGRNTFISLCKHDSGYCRKFSRNREMLLGCSPPEIWLALHKLRDLCSNNKLNVTHFIAMGNPSPPNRLGRTPSVRTNRRQHRQSKHVTMTLSYVPRNPNHTSHLGWEAAVRWYDTGRDITASVTREAKEWMWPKQTSHHTHPIAALTILIRHCFWYKIVICNIISACGHVRPTVTHSDAFP